MSSPIGQPQTLELEELLQIGGGDEAMPLLRTILGRYGIDVFVLARLPSPGQGPNPGVAFDARPEAWVRRYNEAGHYQFDPVARRCMSDPSAFSWDEIPAEFLVDPRAQAVMRDAASFGLKDGFCVPLHGPLGVGGLSVAGAEIDFAPGLRPMLRLLAFHLDEVAAREFPRDNDAKRLSGREREVLTWIAVGKTMDEVADILSISGHTVGEHLKNIRRKLRTSNNAHSVARALQTRQLNI